MTLGGDPTTVPLPPHGSLRSHDAAPSTGAASCCQAGGCSPASGA